MKKGRNGFWLEGCFRGREKSGVLTVLLVLTALVLAAVAYYSRVRDKA